jgi:ribose transport system permease protein
MLLVAVGASILLTRTQWGRAVYAMGGNREAARLSGIRLNSVTVSVFAITGLLAGLAAVINVGRSGVAALEAGNGYELYAVAATVIGGTSLFGGQGGIPGTVIGALLMFTIRNGCALHNLPSAYERVIVGAVVILAVLYDRYGPGRKRAAAGT